MIKAIIFDFWGTLVENGIFPSPVKQVKYILRVPMSFRDFIIRFEHTIMTKPYADMNEAFSAVCEEFRINADERIIERLVGMWNKNELLAKPFLETIEVLERLRKEGIKIALISDATPTIMRVVDKFSLGNYFDEMMFSFDSGLLKTDPEMYHKLVEKLGVEPEEVVVVGDSIPTDIIGAKNAGLKTILLDRRNKREFSPKIVNLREIVTNLENGTFEELASIEPNLEEQKGED
jgi:2-haloalkanoic acid dehalogenase type II